MTKQNKQLLEENIDLSRPLNSARKLGKSSIRFSGQNPLLVCDEVGKTRRSTYTLPNHEFTYGKPSLKDPESAGEVILSWAQHKPNEHSQPGRDFLTLNRKQLKNKVTTSKASTSFRKTHDHRLKQGYVEKQKDWLGGDNAVYGRQNTFDVDIKNLVENNFEYDWVKEKLKENKKFNKTILDEANRKKKVYASLVKSSRNPLLDETSGGQANKEPFKMKRFKKVNSRIVPMK